MKKLSNISESVWGDIRNRSMGKSFKQEDKMIIDEMKAFIENHHIQDGFYKINTSDYTLDILQNIMVKPFDIIDGKLPFKFGKIDGTMWLNDLGLKTLENSPREVTGDFVIYENNFKNFIGGPKIVGGNFSANVNHSLESLDGSPEKVGGNYSILACRYVEDIKGISPEIEGNLEITKSPIVSFNDDDYRKYSNIKGEIIRK